MPTPSDYAYLAGLLDGEGYFQPVDSGRIRCDMTARDTVAWIATTFGGTFNGPYQYADNRRPVWKWCMARLRDRELLLVELLPHLKNKRRSAEAMLELIRHSLYAAPARRHNGKGETPADWVAWRARRAELQQALKDVRT